MHLAGGSQMNILLNLSSLLLVGLGDEGFYLFKNIEDTTHLFQNPINRNTLSCV